MPKSETGRADVLKRMTGEGWALVRNGKAHDIYRHPSKPGTIVLPRHRTLSPLVARNIAKVAGWL